MTRIPKPFSPATGLPERVEEVMADIDACRDICNGALEAGVNVRVGTPAILDGTAFDGAGLALMRADAKPLVQSFERLTAQPSTGHYLGRSYFDSVTKKEMVCVDAGTPRYEPKNGLAAADYPLGLGARVASGGADPIPDLGIDQGMLFRAPTITNAPGDVNNLGTGFTTILTTPRINDLPGTQAVVVTGMLIVQNSSGVDANIIWRIRDTDQADALVAGGRGVFVHPGLTSGVMIVAMTTLGVGDHTLQLSAERVNGGANVNVLAQDTVDTMQVKTHLGVLVG